MARLKANHKHLKRVKDQREHATPARLRSHASRYRSGRANAAGTYIIARNSAETRMPRTTTAERPWDMRSTDSTPVRIELSKENKTKLLSTHNRGESEVKKADRILGELEKWNSKLAKQFVVKDVVPFHGCTLRMIVSSDTGLQPENVSSYIVVSYTWRPPRPQYEEKIDLADSSQWIPLAKAYRPPGGLPEIPLCKRLWDFLLDMRESENEGIWIDQICIDQANDAEKAVAVASMDALYGSARLVFIALEDVRLTHPEACTLSDAFAKVSSDPSWRVPDSAARTLFDILEKIFKARWFSRAWCFHEYHTSSRKIIAVLCEGASPQDPDQVIGLINLGDFRFSLPYLESEPFRSHYRELFVKMLRFFGGQGHAYSNIIGNTLHYGSRYERDKVTIALNISRLALALNPEVFTNKGDMTREDACLQLLILSLAAGDITTLTTRGEKIKYMQLDTERTSWLMWPDETSWSTRHDKPLREGISLVSESQICLELLVLPEHNFHSPTAASEAKAKSFLSSALAAQILSVYGIETDGDRSESNAATISTLACAIECGLDWMVQAWSITADELLPDIEQNLVQIEHLGSQCLDHLFGLGHTRSQTAASFLLLVCILVMGRYWEMSLVVETSRTGNKAICDLKIVGNNFCTPSPSEHKLYGTAKKKHFGRTQTILAVPKVLAGREFTLSDRLWLLERAEHDSNMRWRVLEKVCLLGSPEIEADGSAINLMSGQIVVG